MSFKECLSLTEENYKETIYQLLGKLQ